MHFHERCDLFLFPRKEKDKIKSSNEDSDTLFLKITLRHAHQSLVSSYLQKPEI